MRRVSATWLVWSSAALAVVSVGLAAAPLPGRFAGDSGLPRPEPVAREDAAEAGASLDAILALSPFGRIAPPAEPEPEARRTDLGLTLHGVVIATRPEASSAIVSGASEPARSYAVGQSVADGATLVEVERDHVVLDVAGRRETLSFPEARGAGPDGDDAESSDDAELEDDVEPEDEVEFEDDLGPEDDAEPEDDVESDEDVEPRGDGLDALRALISDKPPTRVRPVELNDDEDDDDDVDGDDDDGGGDGGSDGDGGDVETVAAEYRERLRDDPRRMLDDLGLVAAEGGYEVGEDPAKPLRRAGLEPGDVIAKVNGQQVGDIDRDRRFFDEVVASGRARLEVVRDGERITLSFPLE